MLRPEHEHSARGLDLGLEHVLPGRAGRDLDIVKDIIALCAQRFGNRAHAATLFLIFAFVADEDVGHLVLPEAVVHCSRPEGICKRPQARDRANIIMVTELAEMWATMDGAMDPEMTRRAPR